MAMLPLWTREWLLAPGVSNLEPGFGGFTIRQRKLSDARAGCFQCLAHASAVERQHDLVAEDGRSAAQVWRVKLGAVDEAGAEVDRVGAAAEGYAEAFHRCESSSARLRVRDWMFCRPLSMTTSAIAR